MRGRGGGGWPSSSGETSTCQSKCLLCREIKSYLKIRCFTSWAALCLKNLEEEERGGAFSYTLFISKLFLTTQHVTSEHAETFTVISVKQEAQKTTLYVPVRSDKPLQKHWNLLCVCGCSFSHSNIVSFRLKTVHRLLGRSVHFS